MPCYATGSAEGDANLSAQEARLEASKATRVLCEVLNWLDDRGLVDLQSADVRLWWEEHKKVDAKRVAKSRAEKQRDRRRAALLESLTEEERELLGIQAEGSQ
jgi:hypothetical protein